jgi:hypothetical protein
MEHSSSWEVNRSSVSQEIPCILWNLGGHYRIHNSPPPVPVLNQIDPIHAPSHFSKNYFNIILPATLWSSKCSSFLRCPYLSPVCTSPRPHTCYMLCPSQSSWFDHPSDIWWGVQSIKLFFMQSSSLPCHLVSLRRVKIILACFWPQG